MVWWLFRKKRDVEIEKKFSDLHNALDNSFVNIKKDVHDISKWLHHFKGKHDVHEKKFSLINYRISNIEEALEEIQNSWTAVQTAIQTGELSKHEHTNTRPNGHLEASKQVSKQEKMESESLSIVERLRKLTVMERAVVWALLNTDLKLSYDDLSVALGKDKSTLRGQINNIKTKSEGLIEEYAEKDGKKRFFISEKSKSELLKGIGRREQVAKKSKSES